MRKIQARVYPVKNISRIKQILAKLKVSEAGADIMAPKALFRVIKLEGITATEGNIIKQEMLSLGADAALPWSCVSGGKKIYDCVLMGTHAQILDLVEKLKIQPLKLKEIGLCIKNALADYNKDEFIIKLPGKNLNIGRRTLIMAVINRTPDSFSDAGLYYDEGLCVKRIYECVEAGADIIDIGGESTRPGAKPVAEKEELKRVLPIVKRTAKKIKVPISIDTTKAKVAAECIDAGARIVNDVSALRKDKDMAKVVARSKAGCVLMHAKGSPRTMQYDPKYRSVTDEIILFLDEAVQKAVSFGIDRDRIIIDPGIGFGKTSQHNIEILQNLDYFKSLGRPILLGTSRKSFIGRILDAPVEDRMLGSLATAACGILKGANILRVHDVEETKQIVKIVDEIKN